MIRSGGTTILLLTTFLSVAQDTTRATLHETRVDTLYARSEYSVKDFAWVGEEQLLLLLNWARMGKYYEKLVLRQNGKNTDQFVLRGRKGILKRNCAGDLWLLGKEKARQVKLDKGRILMEAPVSRRSFDQEWSGCVAMTGGRKLWASRTRHRQRVDSLWWQRKITKEWEELRFFIQGAGEQKQEWMFIKDPDHPHAFVMQDQFVLFSHVRDTAFWYSPGGNLERKTPLPYHQLPNWAGRLIQDPVTGAIHTLYEQNARYIIHRIRFPSGQRASKGYQLPVSFPRNIKIREGKVYFIHREPGKYGGALLSSSAGA